MADWRRKEPSCCEASGKVKGKVRLGSMVP